jgi:hypothetical protein
MVEVDIENLRFYTGYKDSGKGYNDNYYTFVSNSNLDDHKDILDKTLLYHGDKLINREYLELPIYGTPTTRDPANDYDQMLSIMYISYPIYESEYCDRLLKKQFKYKITQNCQKIIQYMKDIQNDVNSYLSDKINYYYYPDEHTLPFRDYTDIAKHAYEQVGIEAAIKFLTGYIQSNWLHKYTPNAHVDVVRLKEFAKTIGQVDCIDYDELEDGKWLRAHAHKYNPNY